MEFSRERHLGGIGFLGREKGDPTPPYSILADPTPFASNAVDVEPSLKMYNIWGAVISEVEVDVLTGEMYVRRTDLLEDAGLSTSPQVKNCS